jgi:hypothetical protein
MKRIIFAGLLLVGVMSCSVENEVPANYDTEGIKTLDLAVTNTPVTHYFGPSATAPGYINVSNDETTITIIFQAADGHKIVNSRLDIVGTPTDFETNNGGNLPPGRMSDYKILGTPDDHDTYEIPMNLFEGEDCIYIAPWAIFTKGKGAPHYAGDILGGRTNRASWWYFAYGDCNPVITQVCNSAYAVLGELDEFDYLQTATSPTLNSYYKEVISNNNWGWYEYLDFENKTDYKIFALYTGAGQNDLNKGFQIGTVKVEYDKDSKIVKGTPTLWFSEISMDNHFFVGNDLPIKRPAPGKFTNTGDRDGKFKMIFHTKACWNVIAQ